MSDQMSGKTVERIVHGDQVIAILIRSDYSRDGIEFFTPQEYSQQLAYIKRPAGHIIDPHIHNRVPREIFYTQEVLFIKKGKIRVDLYTEDHTFIEARILETGDLMLLASGGHGFEMLEPTEMIEVKQGPYVGEHDKTRFRDDD
jgi:hypothetical protein